MMFRNLLRDWKENEEGMALVEAVMIFPVLFLMLFGIYDVGHAITVNHKMITASQVVADLVTRGQFVSDDEIDEAVEAARLALRPYASSLDEFGVDIASIEFDEDGQPAVLWRDTQGMDPDTGAVERSTGLGVDGEGVVVVTVLYDYEPTFGNYVINNFRMRETAYARARRSSIVYKE